MRWRCLNDSPWQSQVTPAAYTLPRERLAKCQTRWATHAVQKIKPESLARSPGSATPKPHTWASLDSSPASVSHPWTGQCPPQGVVVITYVEWYMAPNKFPIRTFMIYFLMISFLLFWFGQFLAIYLINKQPARTGNPIGLIKIFA